MVIVRHASTPNRVSTCARIMMVYRGWWVLSVFLY